MTTQAAGITTVCKRHPSSDCKKRCYRTRLSQNHKHLFRYCLQLLFWTHSRWVVKNTTCATIKWIWDRNVPNLNLSAKKYWIYLYSLNAICITFAKWWLLLDLTNLYMQDIKPVPSRPPSNQILKPTFIICAECGSSSVRNKLPHCGINWKSSHLIFEQ